MQLNEIVPWGRSFNEYRLMFNLTDQDLGQSIIGCGDGPASFNAGLTARGGRIVSVDPIYRFSREELERRIQEVYDEIMPQAEKNRDMYVWESIPSLQALGQMRMRAMGEFLLDFEAGKAAGRYVCESLPRLGFRDRQFDLALCSHYLFLYSEHVSLDEHLESIRELCRVATEVRIYPLVTLKGEVSPHLPAIMDALADQGLQRSMQDVEYEFQKGATRMLVVKSQ